MYDELADRVGSMCPEDFNHMTKPLAPQLGHGKRTRT